LNLVFACKPNRTALLLKINDGAHDYFSCYEEDACIF
jgi:hypothetical protein